MGCLSLTYRESKSSLRIIYKNELQRPLEENPSFFKGVLEKKVRAEKKGANSYRYGFNGKELDPEGMGGGGATYDYGFRIYNPQIAKFLSVDPLYQSFPWLSTYQYAQNDPIRNIDIDGLEGGSAMEYWVTGVGRQIEAWWNSWNMFPSHNKPQNPPAANQPAPPINSDSKGKEKPALKIETDVKVKQDVATSNNFEKYQSKVFDHEGGFVDDPDDPGGATNKGITLKTFKAFAQKDLGIAPTLGNLKNLSNGQASVIYKNNYWDKVRGDEIANGSLAYAIYDFNVNAGGNAIKVLQKTINELGGNVSVDGVLGDQTLRAVNKLDSEKLFNALQSNRKNYYDTIIKKNSKLKKFRKGWFKRVDKIKFEKS